MDGSGSGFQNEKHNLGLELSSWFLRHVSEARYVAASERYTEYSVRISYNPGAWLMHCHAYIFGGIMLRSLRSNFLRW